MIDIGDLPDCTVQGSYDCDQVITGVAAAGGYAYIAGGGRLQVIDVSDPANCRKVGSYAARQAQGVTLSGNYAYLASGAEGLQILDVSNPTNCARIGGGDTRGNGNRIGLANYEAGLRILYTWPGIQQSFLVEGGDSDQPFTVETASGLVPPIQWQAQFITNSPALSFSFTDTNVAPSPQPRKFYRVRQP